MKEFRRSVRLKKLGKLEKVNNGSELWKMMRVMGFQNRVYSM